jgi:hypothetical protein
MAAVQPTKMQMYLTSIKKDFDKQINLLKHSVKKRKARQEAETKKKSGYGRQDLLFRYLSVIVILYS